MTSKTLTHIVAAVPFVLCCACGSDPYSGASTTEDSSAPDMVPGTDTPASTAQDAGPGVTPTGQDAGADVTAGGQDAGPVVTPVQQSDILISVSPVRQLDLLFMIDNSPSMAPKQDKLKQQFPKLLAALKDPTDGTYPDLRVAIIDSDLGTGGAWSSGSCGPSSKTNTNYGDLGRFQMIGAKGCGVTDSSALWLEYTKGKGVNYTGDINQVFSCLATNLGTMGCGEEHQLQALEFALAASGIGNEEQQKMLRPSAYLGIVMLTDEDDCSAATNDGMFGDSPGGTDLRNESASLRCATRAHECNGQALTVAPPGYPTTAEFSAPYASCAARTENYCLNGTDTGNANDYTDTSVPTSCVPLKDIHHLAQEIKALKSSPDQILVTGVFGVPLANQPSQADLPYKIAKVPNPNPADTVHPQIFDYWPICYDPTKFSDSDKDTFNVDHAGWGATGGLRMKAFIEEFGGLAFSICEQDYTNAMSTIGDALAKKMENLCIDVKLFDGDLATPGLQAECEGFYRTPELGPDNKMQFVEDPTPLHQCPDGATNGNVDSDCWQLVNDKARCPATGQMVSVLRTRQALNNGLTPNTMLRMACHTCTAASKEDGCNYD